MNNVHAQSAECPCNLCDFGRQTMLRLRKNSKNLDAFMTMMEAPVVTKEETSGDVLIKSIFTKS